MSIKHLKCTFERFKMLIETHLSAGLLPAKNGDRTLASMS